MDDFMDDNGFVFTLDAVLALVIVFIALAAVASINETPLSSQIRLSHNAQDILETMSAYKKWSEEPSVLQNIANILSTHNNDQSGIKEAGQVAGIYLNQTLNSTKYNLTEAQLNITIAANADMEEAGDVAVGVKSCDGYIFRLCVWD
ncbi:MULTISPECIES: hypothetical protein [Methanobacterium]|jgi:hypothetical protein|uniref:Uncharacterized protein n=2 Tax=Methanobacterium veterum TaxID=408577 RepID=A0A9E5DJC3_9EURY|nr:MULTISPECIES: hypothetical protein [Methanobacterium]MCZ3371279.1 hypothetical protein [Methanobacterium veterum]